MNPKDKAALGRVPLHLLPGAGRIYGALACKDGAINYGPYNWRDKPISYMGYLAALERHILALRDGEDLAQDSKVHHLGHIVATASILLDAMDCGTLIDDRPSPGPAAELLEEFKHGDTKGQGSSLGQATNANSGGAEEAGDGTFAEGLFCQHRREV